MADDTVIHIRGLQDLKKGLRQIDKALVRELAAGMAGVADIVLKGAQPLVPSDSGRARASMKVRKSNDGARLAVGGTKAPYFPWLEFGGAVGRRRSVSRPFIQQGRSIYPTMRSKNVEIKREVDRVLEALARQAGFDQQGESY